MQKKTLLIVIDNLNKGGAEILLAGIIKDLNLKFKVIIVTLTNESEFKEEEIPCEKRYSLGFTGPLSLCFCVYKLRQIIKRHKPSLIHSHLFYSSLVARIACPRNIPLIYTLHSEMSKSAFNNSKIITFLEKHTIKRNHAVMAVSVGVLADYESIFAHNPNSFVLKNYIGDKFFADENKIMHFPASGKLKLVAVGNIKKVKNYNYLLNAFSLLKNYNITLDIYGNGSTADIGKLQTIISENNLKVNLKGPSDNIDRVLKEYDIYVSSSSFEGFGIAAVEAMASGLPLLLSDLPVLREVTYNNAIFFDHSDLMSFVSVIEGIFLSKYDLGKLSKNGIEISKKYTKDIYLEKLFSIYDDIPELVLKGKRPYN